MHFVSDIKFKILLFISLLQIIIQLIYILNSLYHTINIIYFLYTYFDLFIDQLININFYNNNEFII
jgi:hypothetical protein